MIIGLTGSKQSGKDTVANFLTHKLNIKKYAFGDELKPIVKQMSGLSDLDKNSTDSYPRNIDYFKLNKYLKKFNYNKLSDNEIDHIRAIEYHDKGTIYRLLLQYVGTNILRDRNSYHWINLLSRKLDKSTSFIISDIRFLNELHFVSALEDSVIYKIVKKSTGKDFHISENELNNVDFTNIIENDFDNVKLFEKYLQKIFKLV